jgi:plastocyanin
MKYTINIIILLILLTTQLSAVTHTITSSGFTFVPNNITINLGDTLNFSLESIHNAREVSLTTWNSNGTTSNGGFEVPLSGGIVVLTEVRTYYYVCVPHASFGMKGTITVTSVTGIESAHEIIPNKFTLHQNYPNPFNPTTKVSFVISHLSFVTLKVFDVLGKEVATLVNEVKQPGEYNIEWNAENMASGLYTGILTAGGITQARKMLLVR